MKFFDLFAGIGGFRIALVTVQVVQSIARKLMQLKRIQEGTCPIKAES